MKKESRATGDLRSAKNIGATIEKCLNEIGIFTLADLEEITAVEALKKYAGIILKKQFPYVITCIPWKGHYY